MIHTIPREIIEHYFQNHYDVRIGVLSKAEMIAIRKLVREKRVDYNIAPIGEQIFRFIIEKNENIFFEREEFENKDIDAIIYKSRSASNIAFIVLNVNKPLINQVFVAAFSYYLVIYKNSKFDEGLNIISLNDLKDKNKQKAFWFASEFLLPSGALRKEIDAWLLDINKDILNEASRESISDLCYRLTIKYVIPLKALLFRLQEEGYLSNALAYINDEKFINNTLQGMEYLYAKEFETLLKGGNDFIDEIMYAIIPLVYNSGEISLEDVRDDINVLGLNSDNYKFHTICF